MAKKKMKLVKDDPWLEPVAKEVENRYLRFKNRLKEIENSSGSLMAFADSYNYLGLNYSKTDGGWYYREWAPRARDLFLMGDFNNWHRSTHRLNRLDSGVWEIFLSDDKDGKRISHLQKYKILVHGENGWHERIPAYSKYVVQDSSTKNFDACIWEPQQPFKWTGDSFKIDPDAELLIYEVHTGMAQEKEGVGTYREFADLILPRVKENGYTAIQMMAVHEHPYYGSFGYHVSNFFAPSSRFGTPDDLKYLICTAHELGIAVIMDLVHSHTVKNFNEGLNQLDGSEDHYFHPGSRGVHPDWDSLLFNYGKWEVMQFLLSNIKYWIKEFHFDGFRWDGVGSMLYFHHGHITFDSQEKYFTDGVEYDAVTYMQLANTLIHKLKSNALSIAEDVSGMPGLTQKVTEGGIGFDYRLGMGLPDFWVRMLKDEKDENWSVGDMWNVMNNRSPLTKTLAYCESHDQALVGDKTIAFQLMDKEMYYHMQKDDGDLVIDRGMALHKMIRLLTSTTGGQAYLNFMGNEFGHPEWIDFPREGNNWSYWYARRQWSLASDENLKYQFLGNFDQAMIQLIKDNHLLQQDYATHLQTDEWHKTLVYEKSGLIFILNFHVNKSMEGYEFPIKEAGHYHIVLNSDHKHFGGHHRVDEEIVYRSFFSEDENNERLKIYVPNRSAIVLKRVSHN